MTRILPGILAMAAVVVASNILVQFFVGDWLTWGAFTYPIAFLVTDVMNRAYGAATARRVVFVGFVIGLICSFIGTQIMGEYGPLVTVRIAIGSATGFLVAQLVDIAVFDRLRAGSWWRAPLVSSFVGSTLDTILFFSIAFSAALVPLLGADGNTEFFGESVALPFGGPELTRWIGTGVIDWCVKIGIALLALVPFRLLTARIARTA